MRQILHGISNFYHLVSRNIYCIFGEMDFSWIFAEQTVLENINSISLQRKSKFFLPSSKIKIKLLPGMDFGQVFLQPIRKVSGSLNPGFRCNTTH